MTSSASFPTSVDLGVTRQFRAVASPRLILLLLIAFVIQNASVGCQGADNVENTGLEAFYGMTNTFLGKVVQPHYITEVATKLKLEKLSDLTDMNRITSDKMVLVNYAMGFAVCIAIGIISIVVMVIACLCFPCCRCCGNCGATDPVKRGKKRKSNCCIVATWVG